MSYAEDILKLRQRMKDAVAKGLVNPDGKDFFEATLLQVMNDAERNRQNCVSQAENLRRQAATMDGQAGAFASVTSIVYNVLNGFVNATEKAEAEEARIEAERVEKEEAAKEAAEEVDEEEKIIINRSHKKRK